MFVSVCDIQIQRISVCFCDFYLLVTVCDIQIQRISVC